MAGTPNRQAIPPEVRRKIEENTTALDALTFTTGTNVTGEEVEALRDAVVTALDEIFGKV